MSEALLRWGFRLMSVWAVLAALLVGAVLVLIADHDPIRAYATLFHGAFLDYFGFADTLVKLSPILLAGLAVALPLRAGLFNIGAEGQIYLGALFATVLALYGPPLPGWLGILLCAAAGMVGGALWAAIPALLRAYRNINEVIVTLLMNYVGINIVNFFVSGPMMAPRSGSAGSATTGGPGRPRRWPPPRRRGRPGSRGWRGAGTRWCSRGRSRARGRG